MNARTPTDAERNTLVRQHLKADERRFSGESVTGFGSLDEPSTASRELEQKAELVRACLVVRGHMRPTRVDVLEVLDAFESMAYSFAEQGTCHGDLESAFERLRDELNRDRRPTHEEQAQFARASWYGQDEPR